MGREKPSFKVTHAQLKKKRLCWKIFLKYSLRLKNVSNLTYCDSATSQIVATIILALKANPDQRGHPGIPLYGLMIKDCTIVLMNVYERLKPCFREGTYIGLAYVAYCVSIAH